MKKPISLAVAAVLFGAALPAQAETLEEALAAAYLNNPTLRAERAAVRAADESVPQALSGWRPVVSLSGSAGLAQSETRAPGGSADQNLRPRSYDLTVTQPLFRGFRTLAATDRAESSVKAAQAALVATEQNVLLAAATAYMDVIEAQAVVELTTNNVQVLERQLQATRDRFRVGEVTRTDVAQAEARVAGAVADRIAAEGELQANRATYERVVGAAPTQVNRPQALDTLPGSLDEAVQLAITSAPAVIARQHTAEAQVAGIREVRGELLPTVNLQASYGEAWDRSQEDVSTETASVVVQATVPLYQAGSTYSRLREQKHRAGQSRIQVDETRYQARESAVQAWENLQAARASIESLSAQVQAAEIALEGVQREAQVGARTVLDVLDQEQELLNARVSLVRAERNSSVAGYQLLAAVGRMTAQSLGLPVQIYDPTIHYNDVRNQWIGSSDAAEEDAAYARSAGGLVEAKSGQ
ncbi:TolC family outer membrane protein [Caenispirillum bisanense]|uniref:TolC family outer membrane protein n=1 Tax=Caenispirillum bisanense TaxID=414052 RepID=UPI0031E421A4